MIKTVNLEMAKLLKEAGFPQNSLFNWCLAPKSGQLIEVVEFGKPLGRKLICSASTSDELLEELPRHTQIYKGTDGKKGEYICHLDRWSILGQHEGRRFHHKELYEALAQMYLWLNSQGLLGKDK